jgi:hypothetical protein
LNDSSELYYDGVIPWRFREQALKGDFGIPVALSYKQPDICVSAFLLEWQGFEMK